MSHNTATPLHVNDLTKCLKEFRQSECTWQALQQNRLGNISWQGSTEANTTSALRSRKNSSTDGAYGSCCCILTSSKLVLSMKIISTYDSTNRMARWLKENMGKNRSLGEMWRGSIHGSSFHCLSTVEQNWVPAGYTSRLLDSCFTCYPLLQALHSLPKIKHRHLKISNAPKSRI